MTQTGRKLKIYLSSLTENVRNVIPIKEQIEMIEYEKEYFSGCNYACKYWISTNSYRTNTFAGGPCNVFIRLEIRDDGNNRGWTFTATSSNNVNNFRSYGPEIGHLRTLGKQVSYDDIMDGNYLVWLPYSGWNNTCVQLSGRVIKQE